eukprot:jgi/Psemu1/60073/gm1.60073_g
MDWIDDICREDDDALLACDTTTTTISTVAFLEHDTARQDLLRGNSIRGSSTYR